MAIAMCQRLGLKIIVLELGCQNEEKIKRRIGCVRKESNSLNIWDLFGILLMRVGKRCSMSLKNTGGSMAIAMYRSVGLRALVLEHGYQNEEKIKRRIGSARSVFDDLTKLDLIGIQQKINKRIAFLLSSIIILGVIGDSHLFIVL